MVAKAFRSDLLRRLPYLADVTEINEVVNWKLWLDLDGIPRPDAQVLRPDRPVLRRWSGGRKPAQPPHALRWLRGAGTDPTRPD